MRRTNWLFVAVVVLFLWGTFARFIPKILSESLWAPADYARITEVDYKAVVVDEPGGEGKAVVTERLTFDVHAASKNNLFWELWRDLCESEVDGVKVHYKVNYVKQLFDDGRAPVEYTQSPKLYWDDDDFINTSGGLGPGKWFHSEGPYNENNRQYECVLFYVDGLYREEVVFEIQYEMYNAAFRYGDASELYLQLFSDEDVTHLTSFRGQILFPNEIMPKTGNYYAHTYGTNSHMFPFVESDTMNPGYRTFSFTLDASQLKFRPYNQYIEFALVAFGEDKHAFTKYASINDYYHEDTLEYLRQEHAKYEALAVNAKRAKVVILLLFSCVVLFTMLLVFALHKRTRKKYFASQPATQPAYFRDIPSALDPHFAAALVFCKHNKKQDIQDGYAAVLLSLTQKGYLELVKINPDRDWAFNNTKIVLRHRPVQPQPAQNIPGGPPETPIPQQLSGNPPPLTPTEAQYFHLILRHAGGAEIPLAAFQNRISADYEHTNAFVIGIRLAITNIGVHQGYFQSTTYKKPKEQAKGWALALIILGAIALIPGNLLCHQTRLDLAFGAFFVLGIGFIACGVVLNRLSNRYILLTQFGEAEYAKWRGLYRFLNSATLLNERSPIDLPLWEDYFIYATAFGISEKVIKALEIRCPNPEASPVLHRGGYYRTVYFHSSRRAFRSATRAAAFTARSGGHGGYGGYGGGGRGGGGGGGGH